MRDTLAAPAFTAYVVYRYYARSLMTLCYRNENITFDVREDLC